MVIGRSEGRSQEVMNRLTWCRNWGCAQAPIDNREKGIASSHARLELWSEVREHLRA